MTQIQELAYMELQFCVAKLALISIIRGVLLGLIYHYERNSLCFIHKNNIRLIISVKESCSWPVSLRYQRPQEYWMRIFLTRWTVQVRCWLWHANVQIIKGYVWWYASLMSEEVLYISSMFFRNSSFIFYFNL